MRPRARLISSVVAATVLVLAACGGDDEEPGAETTPDEPTEGSEETPAAEEPSGEPIVIGSTLALTGAFAATGVIHQIVGEQFVEQLNANGGLLGRPVEWRLLD